MKKIYVCPEVVDSVELVLETMVNDSPGHQVESSTDYNYGGTTEKEDEAAARQRGGDFGSLW